MKFLFTKSTSQSYIASIAKELGANVKDLNVYSTETFKGTKGDLPFVALEPNQNSGFTMKFVVGRLLEDGESYNGFANAYGSVTSFDNPQHTTAANECADRAVWGEDGKLVYGDGSGSIGYYLSTDDAIIYVEVDDVPVQGANGEYFKIVDFCELETNIRPLGNGITARTISKPQAKTNASNSRVPKKQEIEQESDF
jgi:hypothetical protein